MFPHFSQELSFVDGKDCDICADYNFPERPKTCKTSEIWFLQTLTHVQLPEGLGKNPWKNVHLEFLKKEEILLRTLIFLTKISTIMKLWLLERLSDFLLDGENWWLETNEGVEFAVVTPVLPLYNSFTSGLIQSNKFQHIYRIVGKNV